VLIVTIATAMIIMPMIITTMLVVVTTTITTIVMIMIGVVRRSRFWVAIESVRVNTTY